MDYFLERLPRICVPGIVSDIDGTLADNKPAWFTVMADNFGLPEGYSILGLVREYRMAQNVPLWQTPEAKEFLEEMRNSNEMHFTMPQIKDSAYYLNRISTEIIPVSLYHTIRPEKLREGTEKWLEDNYPSAPVAMRPSGIPSERGNEWKARGLERLFPMAVGIIDDNEEVIKHLSDDYSGIVFLYNHESFDSEKGFEIIPCRDWRSVYENVKKAFG